MLDTPNIVIELAFRARKVGCRAQIGLMGSGLKHAKRQNRPRGAWQKAVISMSLAC